MTFREMNIEDLETTLKTDKDVGITETEARKRQKEQGFNELQAGEKQSVILLFLHSLRISWSLCFLRQP